MTTTSIQLLNIFEALNIYGETAKEILTSIENNKLFIDDHDKKITNVDSEKMALLVLGDDNLICPAFIKSVFTINEMYTGREGYAHLSRCSVGGNIPYTKNLLDLVHKCELYNDNLCVGMRIKSIIKL